jgi:hypothetical protein
MSASVLSQTVFKGFPRRSVNCQQNRLLDSFLQEMTTNNSRDKKIRYFAIFMIRLERFQNGEQYINLSPLVQQADPFEELVESKRKLSTGTQPS